MIEMKVGRRMEAESLLTDAQLLALLPFIMTPPWMFP
jgi:hypothetical protein